MAIEVRTTLWVDGDDLATVCSVIDAFLAATTVLPPARDLLKDIRLEVDVAHVRTEMFPASTKTARVATRRPDGMLPIYVSDAERAALLGVPGLPDRVHALLAGDDRDQPPHLSRGFGFGSVDRT